MLDLDRSEILWPKGTEKDRLLHIPNGDRVETFYTLTVIRRYEFIAELLPRLTIFRIPEEKSAAYVTEPFVARAAGVRLAGHELHQGLAPAAGGKLEETE